MRRRLIYWLAMLLLFLGVAFAFSSVFLPADSKPRRVIVDVPPRSSLPDISQRLRAKGVIRNQYAFQLMARVLGESTNLKAGEYELSPHLSLIEIIDKIARGDAVSHWVTIPEGFTLEQIAKALSRQRMAEERRFL
jgi:UPF0755 protein